MPQFISQDDLHAIIEVVTEASVTHVDGQAEVIDATSDDVIDAQGPVEAEAVSVPHGAAGALHQIADTLSDVTHHLQDAIVATQAEHVHDGIAEDSPEDETAVDHADPSHHDDSAVAGD